MLIFMLQPFIKLSLNLQDKVCTVRLPVREITNQGDVQSHLAPKGSIKQLLLEMSSAIYQVILTMYSELRDINFSFWHFF